MDANGTRYHLLLGKEDWTSCSESDSSAPSPSVSPEEKNFGRGLAWNPERSEVILHPRIFQYVAAPKDVPPPIDNRRSAARDRYGNWYWIDDSERKILVNSSGSRTTSVFWPPERDADCERSDSAFQPLKETEPESVLFRSLAVTMDHYLVVGWRVPGGTGARGIIFFDLHAGGPPQEIRWPEDVPFSPFDMCAAPLGGVWILDRANKRYWGLDRQFNIIRMGQETVFDEGGPQDFQPLFGDVERRNPRRSFPLGVELDDSSPLAAIDPVAIESLPDGTVLILDRNSDEYFSLVYRYRLQEQLGPPASTECMTEMLEDEEVEQFSLIGNDIAFVPEHRASETNAIDRLHKDAHGMVADRLYIVAENGNQTFAFQLSTGKKGALVMDPLPDYLPMRRFSGKALVRAGMEVFYDFDNSWIALVEQRRPRYETEATLYTPLHEGGGDDPDDVDEDSDNSDDNRHAFDGHAPDCVWHRLMLDGSIPPETEVRVWSRASNEESELSLMDWQREPALHLRSDGPELPFTKTLSGSGAGTWELLFQNARGRFLQLKLELRGNERTTPRLRALRAYYQRFSYLENYLPAVYREDASSASFLDRFLANLEGINTTLEDRIAAVQMLFDVRSAPPEALEWLASWFGLVLDPTWDEARRRLLIKYAMLFFQYRGTMRGLKMALRLAVDDCPGDSIFHGRAGEVLRGGNIRIIERFQTRQTPALLLGDRSDAQRAINTQRSLRWQPANGGPELHRRYREWLLKAHGARFNHTQQRRQFPLHTTSETNAPVWRQFAQETLGFIPSASEDERRLWQMFLAERYKTIRALNKAHGSRWANFRHIKLPMDAVSGTPLFYDWVEFAFRYAPAGNAANRKLWQSFLARRYRNVAALNKAHATHWLTFEMVSLPGLLPPDGAPLQDWYQFESTVLPMRQNAHRFTVLLPLPQSSAFDSTEQQQRLEKARRVVALEKPAHTIFDIKFYWALFGIGEARLGSDTLLDFGSRSPNLMPPMVLGQGHIVEAYIAPTHPQDVADRQTLGFERLGG